ncbi:MAG TPA: MFS transporter [Jiangellales bacterium]|nr:MFS transporter [Jiangellales bacterium]
MRSTAAGAVGNVVEWYDFAVFGASATLLAAVLTPGGDNGLTGVFAVFAVSFVFRPLGAVFVGALADRVGRRGPLAATLLVMTVATAGIGLLPTWAALGSATAFVLLVLRAAQGFSSGGELVVSVAYLVEHARPDRRGVRGGVHMATMAVGFAAGIGAVAVLQRVLGHETMTTWGWRVPFILAVPLGLVGLYLRSRAAETPEFREPRAARRPLAPLAEAVKGHRATVAAGFLLAAGFASSFNLWFVYFPSRLVRDGTHDLATALAGALLGLLALAVSAVACGRLSDRWGRRPLLLLGTCSVIVLWLVAPAWLADGDVTTLLLADAAMGAALGAFVLQSALADRLPATVRVSGMAVTFGLASALVGGTAPLVASLLSTSTDTAHVSRYALLWALSASVAAARWSGSTEVSEPGGRAGGPVSASRDGVSLAEG